jgi:hypothetical protein
MRPLLTIGPFPLMTALLILSMVSTGCDEAATGPNVFFSPGFQSEHSPFVFNGTVTDASGKAVVGADIHYFGVNRKYPKEVRMMPVKAMPVTTFNFSVAKETHITLRMLRLGSREVMATIIDSVLRAGIYAVSHDMKALSNGWYIFQLSREGVYQEKLTFFFHPDPFTLFKTTPLARTDISGRFHLPHSMLGLEEDPLNIVDLLRDKSFYNLNLSDSIGFIIHNAGTFRTVWTAIDKNSNTNATLTFQ